MKEKDLRKLSRKQLLELLLKQTERADILEAQLTETQAKLEEKNIMKKEAGSIAEAALRLNEVFAAADAAAAQYLENIKNISESSEPADCTDEYDAKAKAKEIIREAEKKCEMMEAKSEKRVKENYIKLRKLQKEIYELEKLKTQM